MTTASQNAAVLARLQRGDTLTPLEALNDPSIRSMRLGARIWDLRHKYGHPEIEKITVTTADGKHVAAYRLPMAFDGPQRIFTAQRQETCQ